MQYSHMCKHKSVKKGMGAIVNRERETQYRKKMQKKEDKTQKNLFDSSLFCVVFLNFNPNYEINI